MRIDLYSHSLETIAGSFLQASHQSSLHIIGVNAFHSLEGQEGGCFELTRTCKGGRDQQESNVGAFRDSHAQETSLWLEKLQKVARERKNTIATLMEAGKDCSLGFVSHALYDVGGEYRRNM